MKKKKLFYGIFMEMVLHKCASQQQQQQQKRAMKKIVVLNAWFENFGQCTQMSSNEHIFISSTLSCYRKIQKSGPK